ncbi:MAG: BolA family protein [Pseudomonadota bacterium]
MGLVSSRIETALRTAFDPVELVIHDDSASHAGHAGSPGGGESHFMVEIVSAAFEGKSRIERHRMVNQALKDELAGPVHALAIKAKGPGE